MNVFEYAAAEERMFELNLANLGSGYKRKTTFYKDLSIAEWISGKEGIKDTFNNVCKSWLSDYKMFTEFVLCLNWKSWEWYERGNKCTDNAAKAKAHKIGELYSDLYYEGRDKFYEKYGEDKTACQYYFDVTD